MKIIFSHGQESTPYGSKIKALSKIAHKYDLETESIDYRNIESPDKRVEYLCDLINDKYKNDDIILVGSSMGGYVSVVTSEKIQTKGVFLLAPALYMDKTKYTKQEYNPKNTECVVVHGYSDDIIPYNNSVFFGNKTKSTVQLIDGDHRLNSSLNDVESLFDLFLKNILKKGN
jgi:predicted esterase